MRILYVDLNPESIFGRTDEVLRSRGHTLFYVSTCRDALKMIRNQHFDSVVITQDSLEVLDFITKAQAIGGELPVFVTDDWSVAELPLALEWCGGLQKVGDPLHG
jgi:CheY-like chemotaxis protein